MIVAAGTLDALANVAGDVSELYGVNIDSLTTASGHATVVLAATVTTDGNAAPGTDPADGQVFTIATVNDQTDVATLVVSLPGALVGQLDDATVVGFNTDALLLYTGGGGSLLSTTTTSLNDADFAVFSPTPLESGTTLDFTSTGVFDGLLTPLLDTEASVLGASGNIVVVDLDNADLAFEAQTELTAISDAILAGTVEAEDITGRSFPTLATGELGAAEIDGVGNFLIPKNYEAVFDLSGGAVNLVAGAAGSHLIIAGGTGDLTYGAFSGTDTVYAGFGNTELFGAGSALAVFGGAGDATIIGGAGGNSITGADGNQLIFGVSTLLYAGGSGAATIVGGGLGNTVYGGSGDLLLFASGGMTYTGSGGAATVIGGGGPLDADLGTGGGVVYGGPGGDNTLSTESGTQSILVGGGAGDLLTASGAGDDVLVAGSGAETINGSAATGNLVIFGGPGADVLSGGTGNDLFVTEGGNETLTGGGGTNSYVFIDFGATARTDVITDFNPNKDAIGLFGYGSEPGADAAALASARVSGGYTTISLSDGTQIAFAGAPTLHSYNFF
jgi:Ca2+-binding RTX toxin-like protein